MVMVKRSIDLVALVALVVSVAAQPVQAAVAVPLNVNGNLTIQGGGANTGPVYYTNATISTGTSPVSISLAAGTWVVIGRGGKLAGEACGTGAECFTTDYCEDGVCCCEKAAGSTVINGTVTPTCYASQYTSATIYGDGNSAGTQYQCGNCAACNSSGKCSASTSSRSSNRLSSSCRASAGVCDVAESCNGVLLTCPNDALVAAGQVCRAASGRGCDLAATCSGASPLCPNNALLASGTVCRAQDAMICVAAAQCNGSSDTCPPSPMPAGTLCREAQGACDVADRCDGVTMSCGNVYLAAGVVCGPSGVACSGTSASCGSASGSYGSGGTCN
jgi:hypothetical protein